MLAWPRLVLAAYSKVARRELLAATAIVVGKEDEIGVAAMAGDWNKGEEDRWRVRFVQQKIQWKSPARCGDIYVYLGSSINLAAKKEDLIFFFSSKAKQASSQEAD